MGNNLRNTVFLGTEMKLNISIDPIGDMTMDDYDFTVDLFCFSTKVVSINKSDAIRLYGSNYVILVDTNKVGTGELKCKVTAYIPDDDFPDQMRTEIALVDTGITIVKNI